MSYHFVYGPSGSGKTYKVFEDCIKAGLADDGSRFLIVVPEQATTAAEKLLIKMHPNHAVSNIEILSFNRLAYRVFDELGIKNPEVLDDISKAMILRRVANEHSEELSVWKKRFDKPGFVDNLKSMISELYQYGIKAEDVEALISDDTGITDSNDSSSDENLPDAKENSDDKLPPRLCRKLHDLTIMMNGFNSFIRDKYITPEEIADILASVINRSSLIKNATIVLDGFTGFTPVQYKIIEEFLASAKKVVFTVSISDDAKLGEKCDSEELFAMSKTMYNDIVDMASRLGVNKTEDVHTDRKISFDFLEKHLLRYDGVIYRNTSSEGKVVVTKNNTEAESNVEAENDERSRIRFARALNCNEEIEFVAADIVNTVKKANLRYRDIAVITSDIESYADIIRHEFSISNIPYYMDENLKLEDNALRLMIDALMDVIKTDYSYDSVMRYLKTGLVSDDEEMINALEVYMFICGKRGYKRLSEDWDYMPRELEGIDKILFNEFKNSVIESVEKIRTAGDTVREKTDAVIELLRELKTEEKLAALAAAFAEGGDETRRREYEKAYEKITELLDRISELAGDDKFEPDDYKNLFDAGVTQLKLGMIPSGIDRVFVGDITRSRLDDIKCLYVIGANEGKIPKVLNRSSVITDSEKTLLGEQGIKLAPTIKEDLFIQRYYLYRMLTKPSEKLIMTYSGMSSDGSGIEPSYLVGHISKLYGGIDTADASELIEICNGRTAMKFVQNKLREYRSEGYKNDEDFEDMYAYLAGNDKYSKAVFAVTTAALYRYENGYISSEAAKKVYGGEINGSPTRLEKFVECPYKHFAAYGLKIHELRRFTMETVDLGNLMHSALNTVFAGAKKNHIDLFALPDDVRNKYVENAVKQALMDDPSSKYADTAHNEYLTERMTKIVQRTLWAQLEEYKKSGYNFYESERAFSIDGLNGRIDRIDVKPGEDGELIYRVVDYKTSGKKFSLSNIEQGFDLQLAIYLAAADEILKSHEKVRTVSGDDKGSINQHGNKESINQNDNKESIVPGGMYYSTIDDPIINADEKAKSRTVEEEILHQMALSGIGDDETKLRLIMDYAKHKVQALRGEILSGDISIAPSGDEYNSSCAFCEYKAVCGFDRKIPGYRMKRRKTYPEDEVWEKIKREAEK